MSKPFEDQECSLKRYTWVPWWCLGGMENLILFSTYTFAYATKNCLQSEVVPFPYQHIATTVQMVPLYGTMSQNREIVMKFSRFNTWFRKNRGSIIKSPVLYKTLISVFL